MKSKTVEWTRIGISEFANHEEWGLLIKIPLVKLPHEKEYDYNAYSIEECSFIWVEDSEQVEPVTPKFEFKDMILL